MTVKELIAILQLSDPDAKLVFPDGLELQSTEDYGDEVVLSDAQPEI